MTSRLSPPRLLPLTIVVMLLLLSAKAVTFANDAVVALGLTQAVVPLPPVAIPAGATEAVSVPVTMPKQGGPKQVTDPERALLEDLRKRREDLDARARVLDERNTVVEAAESSLQSKIDHLESLEGKIDQLDVARKRRQDADWSGLVKLYESMKPRDAAAIFDVLDIRVLLEVVDRMNERKAAAILAAMQPERARVVTQMLAQMRTQRESPGPQISSESSTKLSNQQ